MRQISSSTLKQAHSNARRACSAVHLDLRHNYKTSTSGSILSRASGNSVDFRDYRLYYPGDDPRHIDWKVYARTDQYSLKQFQAEQSPKVDLILDLSRSMLEPDDKAKRTLELLYFVLETSLKTQATFNCTICSTGSCATLRKEELLSYSLPNCVYTDLESGSPPSNLLVQAHSLRIFISDLLYPDSPIETLRRVFSLDSKGILLSPFNAVEKQPDWGGSIEFENCESGEKATREIDFQAISRYQKAYQAHFADWKEACTKFRIPLLRVPADGELSEALLSASKEENVWA